MKGWLGSSPKRLALSTAATLDAALEELVVAESGAGHPVHRSGNVRVATATSLLGSVRLTHRPHGERAIP
jgi:hypothetical protein